MDGDQETKSSDDIKDLLDRVLVGSSSTRTARTSSCVHFGTRLRMARGYLLTGFWPVSRSRWWGSAMTEAAGEV